MTDRFRQIAALAADQHSVVSAAQLRAHGVDPSMRCKWERAGLITRLGPRSFTMAGSQPTYYRAVTAGLADLGGFGVAAGRTAARLHGLDGFCGAAIEFLLPRAHRGFTTHGVVRSARRPFGTADILPAHGLRCLTAERLILESPLFGFTSEETENAIDSAIRLRLVGEQRLRTRVLRDHRPGVNGSRQLLDALVDAGGESRLERWFLQLLRQAGIGRPLVQRTFRDGTRVVARVDA
ncbi:MAG: type IV toxin-antitoxin system AbiEi family antitoxin domain-containing protein [Ilumatobacteraceae bacterium]